MQERIGFISTRFAGLDGVSLESAKWARFLWDQKHISFWYSGYSDRAEDISFCIPEAYFGHPENEWINEHLWGRDFRSPMVSSRVREFADYLKGTLYDFMRHFELTSLCVQNALSIPMHVPLGIAITELLAETRTPAIAHHHDFYWERTRFSVNAAQDYLELAFPPRDPQLLHVVINQEAQEQLSWRKGISSMLIPNVFDFDHPAPGIDDYSAGLREDIGLEPEDKLILQPTRVVPRKGIEHAIRVLEYLDDPRCKLVISHPAGDEGLEYRDMIEELAHDAGVNLLFLDDRFSEVRQLDSQGRKMYTLWDLYPHADLVTYPSIYEGFGNALLEAIYFRVPIVVNRYSIFVRDIEPKGFHLPAIDGYVTRKTVREIRRILDDEDYRRNMVDHNFEIARRYFGYNTLRRSLQTLMTNLTGVV